MDLAELKNMDIKDLLSKFKAGSGGILGDKKLLIQIWNRIWICCNFFNYLLCFCITRSLRSKNEN